MWQIKKLHRDSLKQYFLPRIFFYKFLKLLRINKTFSVNMYVQHLKYFEIKPPMLLLLTRSLSFLLLYIK